MFRRMLILFVLSILFLGLSGGALAQGDFEAIATDPFWRAGNGNDNDDDDGGLGKKIAGAWFCRGCFVTGGNIDTFVDCDSEGAIPAVQTTMFGAAGNSSGTNPANTNSYQGTWKKTGPRQIVDTTILYLTSTGLVDTSDPPDGIPDQAQPQTLSFICRIPAIIDFDRDFQNATSRFSCKGYLSDGDPLDPDAEIFQSQGLSECRKVNPSAEDLFDPPTTP